MKIAVEHGPGEPGSSVPPRRCLVVANGQESFARALTRIPPEVLDGGWVMLAAVVPRPSLWLTWAPVCPREARREAVEAASQAARAAAELMPSNTSTQHLVLLTSRRAAMERLARDVRSDVFILDVGPRRRRAGRWRADAASAGAQVLAGGRPQFPDASRLEICGLGIGAHPWARTPARPPSARGRPEPDAPPAGPESGPDDRRE